MSASPTCRDVLMKRFIHVAGVGGLEATREEYKALKAAIDAANSEDEPSVEFGDWKIAYSDGEVYIGAVFEVCARRLSDGILACLGSLIAKNKLDYFEFAVSENFYEPVPPSVTVHTGIPFRVRSNGSVWEPELSWR